MPRGELNRAFDIEGIMPLADCLTIRACGLTLAVEPSAVEQAEKGELGALQN